MKVNESGGSVEVSTTPIYRYRPEFIEGDILSKIVCKAYNENFNAERGCFGLNKVAIIETAVKEVREWMVLFIQKNLQMRNPKQSKLYRWAYRNMPRDADFNDGLLLLFKYAVQYTLSGGSTSYKIQEVYKVHLDNTLAILDAMREKYEQ
jgi:hypothetical protein